MSNAVLEKLDALYGKVHGLKLEVDVEAPAELEKNKVLSNKDITAKGALTASGAEYGIVLLEITQQKPTKEPTNAQIEFKAELKVNTELQELKAPIIISITLPDGVETENMQIKHYSNEGELRQTMKKGSTVSFNTYVLDGRTVTFRVNSFSIFSFVSGKSITPPEPEKPIVKPERPSISYDDDSSSSTVSSGWVKNTAGWWYRYSNGGYPANKWEKIQNKWYYFDQNGYRQTGWIKTNDVWYFCKEDGTMADAEWAAVDGKWYYLNAGGSMAVDWLFYKEQWYYLNTDGSMKTGWQKITVYDGNPEVEDDRDYWFNFKPNGKKRTSDDAWKYNGKEYAFDSRGVMLYQWATVDDSKKAESSPSDASASNLKNVKEWRYYNSPEDGARVTKGWFKVIAPDEDNDNTFLKYDDSFADGDAKDETERWYYAKAKGELVEGEIYNIKGKYYGFRPDDGDKGGAMLNGLCVLQMDGSKIEKVIADDIDSNDLDDILDGKFANDNWDQENSSLNNIYLYYFGNDLDGDGSMKTGNVTINLDGNSYNFLFKKSGNPASGRGRGVTGIEDKKYIYNYGCKIKASSDDKYKLVKVTGTNTDINSKGVTVTKMDTPAWDTDTNYKNVDDETVRYHYDDFTSNDYYLVNTSGNIQKSKVAAKDGDDWYFYVKDRAVKLYTSDKNLDKLDLSKGGTGANGVSEKWDSRPGNATTGAGIYVSDLTTGY